MPSPQPRTKPATAACWRYNTVAGFFFAACAYVQLTDPDPRVRLAGYLVGGTCWSVTALCFPTFARSVAPAIAALWLFIAGMLAGLALPLVQWPVAVGADIAVAELIPVWWAAAVAFLDVQSARECTGGLLLAVHTLCAPRPSPRFVDKAVFVGFALATALWVCQPDVAVRKSL